MHKHKARVLNCWRAQCPTSARQPCWLKKNPPLADGLDIFGFFLSEIGLGHTARLYHRAARAEGIDAHAINRVLPGRQAETQFEDSLSRSGSCKAGLSIDGLVGFGGLRREICRTRWNIALPLWELETVPRRRIKHLAQFDALWAPSQFIKENLERATGRSVELIRHPLDIPDLEDPRGGFSGPLKILFFFDFDSFPARKNPEGAVLAFQQAFSKGEDVVLTIKTRGVSDEGRRAWLMDQASRDRRISIIDETLPYDAIRELLRRHDVFLSLHRSEGFGLGCAEALALGNIVVATDYGGTRDFISEATGFPVAWRMVPVREGEYTESEGASWADPVIEHAAQRLREIYAAPELARERALLGRRQLRRHHAIKVVGRKIRDILGTEGILS